MSMSELVAIALNQSVLWMRKVGQDHYGEDRFDEPKPICCRVSFNNRLVINDKGEQVTSGAEITVLDPVEIGDRITLESREFVVIDVSKPRHFDGSENRRKVYI